MSSRSKQSQGFSLIELLLVLAILGIISAIAIPSFLGQRRRARVIGDARSNAHTLIMALEGRKAETGTYGAKGIYTWSSAGARPSVDPAPTFIPKGSTKMDFSVEILEGGITYNLSVTDPSITGAPVVVTATQVGAIHLDAVYNK